MRLSGKQVFVTYLAPRTNEIARDSNTYIGAFFSVRIIRRVLSSSYSLNISVKPRTI